MQISNQITLKQLRVFIALTRHNSLTQAANSLCLSKAAVSLSLSELEKHIGCALFDRVKLRLILNHQGHRLLPLADELISRAKLFDDFLSHGSADMSQLVIGASDTIGNQFVPVLLHQLRSQEHRIPKKILIANTQRICQKISEFELDIGFIEGDSLSSDLICTPFFQDNMCVICPPNHPLAKAKNATLGSLNHYDWVLREQGSGSRHYFLHQIATQLTSWQEILQINSTEALVHSVSQGLGLACLSELSARYAIASGRIAQVPLTLPFKRTFSMVLHKDKYHSPLLNAFIQQCHQKAQSLQSG